MAYLGANPRCEYLCPSLATLLSLCRFLSLFLTLSLSLALFRTLSHFFTTKLGHFAAFGLVPFTIIIYLQ